MWADISCYLNTCLKQTNKRMTVKSFHGSQAHDF
jgi:hypothetical protein